MKLIIYSGVNSDRGPITCGNVFPRSENKNCKSTQLIALLFPSHLNIYPRTFDRICCFLSLALRSPFKLNPRSIFPLIFKIKKKKYLDFVWNPVISFWGGWINKTRKQKKILQRKKNLQKPMNQSTHHWTPFLCLFVSNIEDGCLTIGERALNTSKWFLLIEYLLKGLAKFKLNTHSYKILLLRNCNANQFEFW